MHRTFLKRAATGLTALTIAGGSLLVMASPASAAPMQPVLTALTRPTVLTNDTNEVAGNWELSLPEGADTIDDTTDVTITLPCPQTTTGVGFAATPTIPASFGTGSVSGTCSNILTINLAADFEAGDEVLIENVRYTITVDAAPGPLPVQVNGQAAIPAASNAILARVDRPFAGATRFDTAALIAKAAFPAPNCVQDRGVIIASGGNSNFPDALAASALAGKRNVPILLVNPTGALPAETIDALAKLGVTKATIIGGTTAVATTVENALAAREIATCGSGADQGNSTKIAVTRIAGQTRYETARAVAEAVGPLGNNFDNGLIGACDAVPTAFLVSGTNYPDALAVGALAAKGSAGGCGTGQIPILLTNPTTLSPEVEATANAMGIKQMIIVGGTTAVSSAVETAVNNLDMVTNVERISGETRQLTAKAVAGVALDPALGSFAGTRAFVATGVNFPDALTIGPIAGANEAPVLLTDSATTLGAAATDVLKNTKSILHATLLGGTTALSDAVKSATGAAITSRSSAI